MVKVCVTGGAGFIGSHLVERLLKEDHEVLVADDFSRGRMINLTHSPQATIRRVDLRDYEKTAEVLEGVDVVFHLAARVGSIDYLHGSNDAELEAFQDNVTIDANLFRACRCLDIPKIVYASSVSVYSAKPQMGKDAVLSEDACDLSDGFPDGGYGWAKRLGEYQLQMTDVKASAARLFGIYGTNMAIDGTAQVVAALMKKLIERNFVVWGDGNVSRDFTFVSDCVDALMLLEEKASRPPFIANVGSGSPVSIRELARKIASLSEDGVTIRYDKTKPVGMTSRTANIDRIKEAGWRPKIGLDEGLKRTYNWLESRLKAEKP